MTLTMNVAVASPSSPTMAGQARLLMVAMNMTMLFASPVYVATAVDGPSGSFVLAFSLAAVAVALQIRHGLAASRGLRPRGWELSLFALAVVTLVPLWWWEWNWAAEVALLAASVLLLLPARPAVALVCSGLAIMLAAEVAQTIRDGGGAADLVFYTAVWTVGLSATTGGFYGSARLALYLDELYATRADLAEIAIGRERMRLSRDLHDLLGQSLSAVSLKGDLATRLLAEDPARARREIQGISSISATALLDMRGARGDHQRTAAQRRSTLLHPAGDEPGRDRAGDRQRPGAAASGRRGGRQWAHRPGRADRHRGWHGERRADRHRLLPAPCRGPGGAIMIRVLIAEDMHMIRGALVALLDREPDMEVVAAVDRGDTAVSTALETKPDVAILDIEMPGLDGLAAAQQIHDALPDCQTLVLTGLTQPGNLLRALSAHVRGFIPKDAPAETLADGVRRVARGELVIDTELVAAAIETGSSPLTTREVDVLRAAQMGSSTEQIAQQLHLSQATVRNYISNAINKVGARNRLDAIRITRDAGWL